MKIEIIFLLCLITLSLPSPKAYSKCGENKPAKYQAVLTFAGDNQLFREDKLLPRETFDEAIQASTESLGRHARKDLLLLGGSKYGYGLLYQQAWKPDPLPENAIVMKASRRDWLNAAKMIADD